MSDARMTFDHEAAWEALAYPAWLALKPETRALAERVGREAREWAQGSDCDVKIPEGVDAAAFWALFGGVDTEELARASQAVYFVGHWNFQGSPWDAEPLGITWKFSNLADQELTRRLGLVRSRKGQRHGWGLVVHEGCLRLTAAAWNSRQRDIDYWTWEVAGLAVPEVLAVILRGRGGFPVRYERVEAAFKRVRAAVPEGLRPWDTEGFRISDRDYWERIRGRAESRRAVADAAAGGVIGL